MNARLHPVSVGQQGSERGDPDSTRATKGTGIRRTSIASSIGSAGVLAGVRIPSGSARQPGLAGGGGGESPERGEDRVDRGRRAQDVDDPGAQVRPAAESRG